MPGRYHIRDVKTSDAEDMMELMNYFVANSFAAYNNQKLDLAFFHMLRNKSVGYPFLVAEDVEGELVGFALLHQYHRAETFNRTAEITYFIHPDHTHQGLGKRFLGLLIEKGREMGVETILASVSSLNEQSLNFHLKYGFKKCGEFERIGRKFNRDFSVIWFQLFIRGSDYKTMKDYNE